MLSTMTQDERERLRAEFLRKAAEGFDWTFDPNRQSNMRTFTQREDRAMEIGTGLARWALEHHVGEDVQAKPSAPVGTCPQCGGAARGSEVSEQEAREIQSRAGKVSVGRPGSFCPHCRRRFSSSRP
jgi:hypothetical protein